MAGSKVAPKNLLIRESWPLLPYPPADTLLLRIPAYLERFSRLARFPFHPPGATLLRDHEIHTNATGILTTDNRRARLEKSLRTKRSLHTYKQVDCFRNISRVQQRPAIAEATKSWNRFSGQASSNGSSLSSAQPSGNCKGTLSKFHSGQENGNWILRVEPNVDV